MADSNGKAIQQIVFTYFIIFLMNSIVSTCDVDVSLKKDSATVCQMLRHRKPSHHLVTHKKFIRSKSLRK